MEALSLKKYINNNVIAKAQEQNERNRHLLCFIADRGAKTNHM